jgi:putative hydrolase of the HAD superfamily
VSAPVVDAVTFDFWHTIVAPTADDPDDPRDDRWNGVLTTLQGAGVEVTREQLDHSFARLFEVYEQRWIDNQIYTAVDAVDFLLELHQADVDQSVKDSLVATFQGSSSGDIPQLTPNLAEALARIDEAGIKIGIICDVGLTPSSRLREYLEGHGVLQHFDHWSFSDEVGVYKPDPVIFRHALEGLGIAPDRAAHIGDLRRTDVAGAKDMGMLAIRYRGSNDDTSGVAETDALVDGDHVIDDHKELPAILGIES